MTDDPRAEDALVEKLTEALYRNRDLGPGYMMHDDCEHIARQAAPILRDHEAGLAAAVGALMSEWAAGGAASNPFPEGVVIDVQEEVIAPLRRALTDAGAADTLRRRDAKVLREAAEEVDRVERIGQTQYDNLSVEQIAMFANHPLAADEMYDHPRPRISAWLRERAEAIEGGGDR